VVEAKKRYSDWDALAEQLKASDVDISEAAAEEIAKSAHSADVLHFLMERPDVIREISGLEPGQQIEKNSRSEQCRLSGWSRSRIPRQISGEFQ